MSRAWWSRAVGRRGAAGRAACPGPPPAKRCWPGGWRRRAGRQSTEVDLRRNRHRNDTAKCQLGHEGALPRRPLRAIKTRPRHGLTGGPAPVQPRRCLRLRRGGEGARSFDAEPHRQAHPLTGWWCQRHTAGGQQGHGEQQARPPCPWRVSAYIEVFYNRQRRHSSPVHVTYSATPTSSSVSP